MKTINATATTNWMKICAMLICLTTTIAFQASVTTFPSSTKHKTSLNEFHLVEHPNTTDFIVMPRASGGYEAFEGLDNTSFLVEVEFHSIMQKLLEELKMRKGGHIHLKSGVYVVNLPIELDEVENILITGSLNTMVKMYATIRIRNRSENVQIRKVTFTGASKSRLALNIIDGCKNIRISNCRFIDLDKGAIQVNIGPVHRKEKNRIVGLEIDNCAFKDIDGDNGAAIWAYNVSQMVVRNNVIDSIGHEIPADEDPNNSLHGVAITNCVTTILVQDNIIKGCKGNGIFVNGSTSPGSMDSKVKISGNVVTGCGMGLEASSGEHVCGYGNGFIINGNTFSDNGHVNHPTLRRNIPGGMFLNGTGHIVTDNFISLNQGFGINLRAASFIVDSVSAIIISNNVIADNGRATLDPASLSRNKSGIQIAGAGCAHPDKSGFDCDSMRWCDQNCEMIAVKEMNLLITDNLFYNELRPYSQKHGIFFWPYTGGAQIEGNRFFEHLDRPIAYQRDDLVSGIEIRDNRGFVTEKSGLAKIKLIGGGATSITIAHGLDITPDVIQLTPQSRTLKRAFWVSDITDTTFDIKVGPGLAPTLPDALLVLGWSFEGK